jgi:hypothetical protein
VRFRADGSGLQLNSRRKAKYDEEPARFDESWNKIRLLPDGSGYRYNKAEWRGEVGVAEIAVELDLAGSHFANRCTLE